MNLDLIHTLNDSIALRYNANPLFTYVYQPRTPALESTRPYMHPVHTLAGNLVTIFRPHDHTWHHGISMTSAHLSDQNFWGGATYVRDQGYVQLPNNGAQQHIAWDDVGCTGVRAWMREQLRWVTQDGQHWLNERRDIEINDVDAATGCWGMDWRIALTNTADRPLHFGSPTTAGRPLAGYGGLFWRGPRSFTGGTILAANGMSGEEVMGHAAPWLAFIGAHDGNAARSTLIFVDDPRNLRYPTKWFVRSNPYGCVSFAFSFDEEYALQPGETLELRYRILIADGEWTRDQIEARAQP